MEVEGEKNRLDFVAQSALHRPCTNRFQTLKAIWALVFHSFMSLKL